MLMSSHFLRLAILGFGLLAASTQVLAHHSFSAEFDGKAPITIQGRVTRVAWTSPHVWIYVNVPGPDGKLVNWGFEMGAPHQVQNAGWTREMVKPGDELLIDGFKARDGSNRMNAQKVTMVATGKVLTALGAGAAAN
jgi:hypothetical protein